MCVYIYVSYTNTDIYRKDTFPKGILRENVNRLYLAVLPTWYKQDLEKCGGLGTPGEGRSGNRVRNPEVTCEMERMEATRMGSPGERGIRGIRLFLPRSREQARKILGRNRVGDSITEPRNKAWAVETMWVLVAGFL